MCQRAAYLLPRFFSPFTDSLFVSLSRANDTDRQTIARHAAALSWVLVISGLALTCAIVAVGDRGSGEAALAVLAVASTVRAVYVPGFKRLQAEGALGTLPRWFVVSMVTHIALAIILTMQWSLAGTALSVLLVAVAFEAWPVAWAAHHHEPSSGALSAIALTPTITAFAGGALLLLLTWCRIAIGGWGATAISGVAALALGSLAVRQLILYLRSSRSVIVRG